jgi:hypothetical protein
MGPTNYRPRHNNYQPLRDTEQKVAREASEQTVSQDREPERNDRSLLERMPGGPDRGDMVTHNAYANAQVRASHEQRQAEQAREERATPSRTPARELVEQKIFPASSINSLRLLPRVFCPGRRSHSSRLPRPLRAIARVPISASRSYAKPARRSSCRVPLRPAPRFRSKRPVAGPRNTGGQSGKIKFDHSAPAKPPIEAQASTGGLLPVLIRRP